VSLTNVFSCFYAYEWIIEAHLLYFLGSYRVTKEKAMKELIERIARALVDKPEEVMVTALQGSQSTVLELKVAKEDLGKIIGKQGRTARSLRTILGAASAKERKRVVLEIVE
jgi:predicted RNA-binding protein YlqC (UPF0109 family)